MKEVPLTVEWVDCVACDGTGGHFGDSDIECFVCDGRGQVIKLSISTPDPGTVYSIGPAVDPVKLKAAMDEFSREPWDLPPAYPTPTPGDPK